MLQETIHDKPGLAAQVVRHPRRRAYAELEVWTQAMLGAAKQYADDGDSAAGREAMTRAVEKVQQALTQLTAGKDESK